MYSISNNVVSIPNLSRSFNPLTLCTSPTSSACCCSPTCATDHSTRSFSFATS
jgi:hypothetical protein